MKRQHRFVLIASTLAFSWLAMQAVHEFGHATAAFMSGGKVAQVVLHPAVISYTRLASNPQPLFVVWMGPVVGVVLPLIAWVVARARRWQGWYLFQFFAGFCLIANGTYLAFGSFSGIGDAGDLVRHGTKMWLLWLFGLTTIPIGLWLWNGLGPHFGFGSSEGKVDRAAAHIMLASLVVLVTLEIVFSSSSVSP
jgi:hypothetical protein